METAELKRSIRKCENMEYGQARLQTALELLLLADKDGDPWSRIVTRSFVSWGYLMSDDMAKALPYCAEFFHLIEEYPHIKIGAVHELSLACETVTVALCLPQISMEQCKSFLDQFEQRCKHYNMGKHYFHKSAFYYYHELGVYEEAERHFDIFSVEPMEKGWACEGCRVGSIAHALICLERRDEAIRVAEPLLLGKIKCNHNVQPAHILSVLVESDLEHGDMEGAANKASQLARIGFTERGDLGTLSTYLLYLTFTDPEHSLRLLEKGIGWSVGMWTVEDLFYIYRSAWALCTVLAKNHPQLFLQLPKNFPLFREDGDYKTAELAEWFYKKALENGDKFDKRNGLDHYREEVAWVEKLINKIYSAS